jgi:O-antigen ligase
LIGTTLLLGVLLAGLVLTFSQSSLAGLLVSCVVLAALRWNARPVLIAAGVLAVLGLGVAVAFPSLTKVDLGSGRSLKKATSGRTDLVKGGVKMFLHRPVLGYGSGAFAKEFRRREKTSDERAASASHTIPITVAAEQGVPGLGAYAAVLVASFGLMFSGLRGLRDRAPPPRLVTRAYLAAAYCGLVLHTLLYAAFLEDPITWTLVAVAVVLGRPGVSASSAEASSSAPASSPSPSPSPAEQAPPRSS